MQNKVIIIILVVGCAAMAAMAQRPPGGGPPWGDRKPPMDNRQGPPDGDWIRPHDTNNNGNLEGDEFQGAMERTFAELDRNKNGAIDVGEAVRPIGVDGMMKRPTHGGPPQAQDLKRILPPFFFHDRADKARSYARVDFERIALGVFGEMDKNGDGTLTRYEARYLSTLPGGNRPRVGGPEMPPNARFVAAELRFGDKLVKGQPFSAETVITNTRLLFDGTLVEKEMRGNFYRDGSGRTRREMPMGMIGGVSILGADKKPQLLIFINDFGAKTQYFLDHASKTARKSRLDEIQSRPFDVGGPPGAKVISDGVKVVEGISCVATRTEFEIPVGQIGNEKPIKVVDERCFSEELQVVVSARHSDPMTGIHSFKLVGTNRKEPSPELFAVPAGYRVENQAGRWPE